jgi:hypothetical protein
VKVFGPANLVQRACATPVAIEQNAVSFRFRLTRFPAASASLAVGNQS